MIGDALALIKFLQDSKVKYDTLSALFDAEGNRLSGSDKIEIQKVTTQHSDVWFYKVKPVEDYVFVPMPVMPCYTAFLKVDGVNNPVADFFRFTPSELNQFSNSGNPNLIINFSVIGYKPSQLLSKLETR